MKQNQHLELDTDLNKHLSKQKIIGMIQDQCVLSNSFMLQHSKPEGRFHFLEFSNVFLPMFRKGILGEKTLSKLVEPLIFCMEAAR